MSGGTRTARSVESSVTIFPTIAAAEAALSTGAVKVGQVVFVQGAPAVTS